MNVEHRTFNIQYGILSFKKPSIALEKRLHFTMKSTFGCLSVLEDDAAYWPRFRHDQLEL
jgi:hypothetical protein